MWGAYAEVYIHLRGGGAGGKEGLCRRAFRCTYTPFAAALLHAGRAAAASFVFLHLSFARGPQDAAAQIQIGGSTGRGLGFRV